MRLTPNRLYQAVIIVDLALLLGAPTMAGQKTEKNQKHEQVPPTQGILRVETAEGKTLECPLKHTRVSAEISPGTYISKDGSEIRKEPD